MNVTKLTINIWTLAPMCALVCALTVPTSALASVAAGADTSIAEALEESLLADESLMQWAMSHDAFQKPAEIEKHANQLSVEVLAKNIEFDAHFLTTMTQMSVESAAWLALMDSLAARVPEYAKSPAVTLARGSMRLKMAQIETARALLKPLLAASECTASEMTEICTPIVSTWLKTGKVQAIDLHAILHVPAMADARLPCASVQEQSLALTLPLLAASLDKQSAARFAIRSSWPGLVAGCDNVAEGVREMIEQAYPASELEGAYAGALASVAVAAPRTLLLLGEDLPLPLQECDFAKAADCSIAKVLDKLTAGRIAQRLQLLSAKFNYQGGQCKNHSDAEQERIDALAEAFETGVAAAAKMPVAQRAATLSALLTEQFRPLDYKLDLALAEPVDDLAKLDAAAALSVQQALVALRGTGASSDAWQKLAQLQLETKQPQAALVSLQQALRLDYSSHTARLESMLSAILSGAEITRPYGFDMNIARPWVFFSVREMDESGDVEPIILAMLTPVQRKERNVEKRWIQVLNLAADLAGNELELSYLDQALSEQLQQPTLKGRWLDNHVALEGVSLPWPDQFASKLGGETPRAITSAERAAIFKALQIDMQPGK